MAEQFWFECPHHGRTDKWTRTHRDTRAKCAEVDPREGGGIVYCGRSMRIVREGDGEHRLSPRLAETAG